VGVKPISPESFRVAFVCTGNRFRSALAVSAFRSVAADLPVEADSFGTLDIGSAPPLPEAVEVGEMYGLDISGHLAKSVATADLSQTSLVVGFEPRHIAAVVDIAGARPEKAFLLRELVDLLEQVGIDSNTDPVQRAKAAVERANLLRRGEPERWLGREIGDPIGLARDEQLSIGHAVCEGAIRLAQELFGTSR
jgi:protein-tyrosine-phosphatase